jgi:hypothetical protein
MYHSHPALAYAPVDKDLDLHCMTLAEQTSMGSSTGALHELVEGRPQARPRESFSPQGDNGTGVGPRHVDSRMIVDLSKGPG